MSSGTPVKRDEIPAKELDTEFKETGTAVEADSTAGADKDSADKIEPEALSDALKETATPVIDVRSEGEFAQSHISQAVNIPLPDLQANAERIAVELEDPAVVLCEQGPRSEQAASDLIQAGADNIKVLSGGMKAWKGAGGDVVSNSDHWAMERQVRLVAGSLVLGGVLSSVFVPRAKWLSAGVGAGLVSAALSGTCGMAKLLALLPYNRPSETELTQRIGDLSSAK